MSSVVCSPTRGVVVSGHYGGVISVWDAHTGKQDTSCSVQGHSAAVQSASFSPDGKWLASGSSDLTIRLWNSNKRGWEPTGAPLRGHTSSIQSVAFSPDGTHLASGGWDSVVRIWNVEAGEQDRAPFDGHQGALVTSVAFSPGNRACLVSVGEGSRVRLWDTRTKHRPVSTVGGSKGSFQGHIGTITSASFSMCGRRIATSGVDRTIRIWDVSSGRQIGDSMRGHTAAILSVSFSPDGTRVASAGGWDMTVRIWNPSSGKQVGSALHGHTGPITSVSFAPNGKRVASGSRDGTVRIWHSLEDVTKNCVLELRPRLPREIKDQIWGYIHSW